MTAQFVQFFFWRLDPGFQALESNERIVAKQSFLGAWESLSSRALLVSYSLTGLRSDCDILCLRVADSLELLQDITCRLQSAGMGKFLVPAYSYLATDDGIRYEGKASGAKTFAPGQGRYLFFSPWAGGAQWRSLDAEGRRRLARSIQEAAAKRGLRPQPSLRALDEFVELIGVETDKPEDYPGFAAELETLAGDAWTAAGPTFVCVLKDIRDLVDLLG